MIKKPGFYFCIIAFLTFSNVSNASGEEASLFEPDGGYWMQQKDKLYISGYIAGYTKAKTDAEAEYIGGIASLIKSLEEEGIIPKAKSGIEEKIFKISKNLLNFYSQERSYEGITLLQLLEGVDGFYKDSANIKITIPYALDIVRLKVRGEKEDYIKCKTELYRMSIFEKDKSSEKIINKTVDCAMLRK